MTSRRAVITLAFMETNGSKFLELLHIQIGNEFAAHQSYTAIAVYYDYFDLPQLASYFYKQAVEEHNHAMMMVKYFIDRSIHVAIPDVPRPRNEFRDHREPIAQALAQENEVTEQISNLARAAREEGDYVGEQFMQWFLKEQIEEMATMTTLLTVCDRADGNLFFLEDFVAREMNGPSEPDATAPPVAGGTL